jgi:hypothetical protein
MINSNIKHITKSIAKVILFVLVSFSLNAQTYEYTRTTGGLYSDQILDGCTDSSGNIYFIGGYQDSIDFKESFGGGDKRKAWGNSNIFITKINTDRSYGWTKTLPYNQLNCAITCDYAGNVFVVSSYPQNANFGYDFGIIDRRPTMGQDDISLFKINADGSYGGVKTFGGNYFEYPHDIQLDMQGNIYIAGHFTSDAVDFGVDFGGNDIKTTVNHKNKAFVTKINADYTYGWTKVFGDNTSNSSINEISIDFNGNVFVTGMFTNQVNFQLDFGGVDVKLSEGDNDAFIAKINADASYGWTHIYGSSYDDRGISVVCDADGNVFTSGVFIGEVNFKKDFGGNDIKSYGANQTFYSAPYVLKMDTDGHYIYSKVISTHNISHAGGHLTLDTCGNPIVVGRSSDTNINLIADIDFGSDFGTHDIRRKISGSFYTSFYSDGSYGSTKTIEGETAINSLLIIDKNNTLVLAGGYFNPTDFGKDFDTSDIKYSKSNVNSDIFFTVLSFTDQYNYNSDLIPSQLSYCGTLDTTIASYNSWPYYLWSTSSNEPVLKITQAGSYWLKVKTGTCSFVDTIEVIQRSTPEYSLSSESLYFASGEVLLHSNDTINLTLNSNQPIHLNFKITDTSSTNTNYWNINGQLVSENRVWSHDFFYEGVTKVKSKVENEYGCFSEKETLVIVKPLLFIPTLVTANSDLKNDVFEIFYNGKGDYKLQIYNRWGDQVFQSSDRFQYWEGNDADGIYYYHLLAGSSEYKGWVQLIR